MNSPFSEQNIIVLDLEILNSPQDLPTGWSNKPALGLSVGCYWDYLTQRIVWFDEPSLIDTMLDLVERQPLMVSFNGKQFDFPLMRGLVRRHADRLAAECPEDAAELVYLADKFKELSENSYDILEKIWEAGGRVKGTSLDAICRGNGLGGKSGEGTSAPLDWADGEYARVLNYCQNDVYLTRDLFERIARNEGRIQRVGEWITLSYITTSGADAESLEC